MKRCTWRVECVTPHNVYEPHAGPEFLYGASLKYSVMFGCYSIESYLLSCLIESHFGFAAHPTSFQ